MFRHLCWPNGLAAGRDGTGGWQLHGNDATDLWRWRMREMKGSRGGQAGRQAVAPKEGREWDAIREKSRYREPALTASWLDGLSEIQGK